MTTPTNPMAAGRGPRLALPPPWLLGALLLGGVVFVPTLRSLIPTFVVTVDNFVVPVAAILAAWSFPRPALALAMTGSLFAPALSSVVASTRIDSGAMAAAVTALLVLWPRADQWQRRVVAGVVAPLTAISIFTGCIWPEQAANRDLFLRTVLLAGVVAGGVALAPYSERDWARTLGPVGAWVSWTAMNTAGIEGRDVAVLGLNVNGIGLLSSLGLLAAVVGIRFDKRWLVPVYVAFGYLNVMGIEAARSRGSYVIIVLAALGWLLQRQLANGGIAAFLGLVSYAGFGLWAALTTFDAAGSITERVGAGADSRVGGRSDAFKYHLGVGLDHLLTGVGLGNSEVYAARDPFATNRGLNSHDMVSGLLSQVGIIPLALYLLLMGLAFRRTIGRSRWYVALVTPALASTVLMMWWPLTSLSAILFAVLAASAAQSPTPLVDTSLQEWSAEPVEAHSEPAALIAADTGILSRSPSV